MATPRSIFTCKPAAVLALMLSWHSGICGGDTVHHYIGTDVFKVLVTLADLKNKEYQLRMVEVIYKAELDPLLNFNSVAGYARLRQFPTYKNLDYNCRAGYLKAGVDVRALRFFWLGWNGMYTVFSEWGEFIVDGAYFGNLRVPFPKRTVHGIGLESTQSFHFRANSWHFILGTTFTLLATTADRAEVPVSFVPAAGFLPIMNRRSWFGMQFQLLYAFPFFK